MNTTRHQFILGKDILATFRGDFRTMIGTTLILIVSMFMLIAPARAQNLSAEVKLYNSVHN
jgi:hypothetical protein